MPRRTRPLRDRAEAYAREAEALRPVIRTIARKRKELASLSGPTCDELVGNLVDAVGFAKADLADILAGKRMKPTAWMFDIFTRDVCDALRKVGTPVPMDPDPQASFAQSFAIEIAKASGFRGMGNLFHQMQRARQIEKTRWPDVRIVVSVAWPAEGDADVD